MIKRICQYINRKIEARKHLKTILKGEKGQSIFLIGSPLHRNIGDHAISIAERKILQRVKEKSIIEIPGEYYSLCYHQIKKAIKPKDIILITGGGFLGTLWMDEEKRVRHIIRHLRKNRIIIMPQTVFFEDTPKGKRELKKSKEIYEMHPDLWLFVREKKSYQYCKENLTGVKNLFLLPETVLCLNYQFPKETRDGILLCLRNDKEKVMYDEEMQQLEEYFKTMGVKLKKTSTIAEKMVGLEERQEVFEKKLLEFKRSKLVITDRLHGMIFAVITATPCIAINNLSGKVKGVYEWIKDIEYLTFLDKTEDISKEAKKMLEMKGYNYSSDIWESKFDQLIEMLNETD